LNVQSSAQKTTSSTLIFQDDFSVNNLADPAGPWATGFPWGQTLNQEWQYYTRYDKNFQTSCMKGGLNHVYTSSGTLKLTAKTEPGSYEIWDWPGGVFTPFCKPYQFTSGMLWSRQQFLYGLFEIRCKIPHAGAKLFPAFWLWSGDPYREIDIFEFERPGTPNLWLTNIHIDRALDFGQHHPPGTTAPTNDYPAEHQLTDVSGFHTYGVLWRPDSVTWLFDGQPVRVVAGHSPPLPMNLIVNLAMASWRPPPQTSDLPAAVEIDYVRVHRIDDPEFLYHWGNEGSGKLALWNMHADDRFFAGDFSGGPRSEILAISTNGWAHLMRWDGTAWQWKWGNAGANKIALWQMKASDRYVTGDFNGDGRDDLVAIGANGWAHMMRWDGADWQWVWGNNGGNKIALWQMKPDDRYIAGDFDGDGRDELLVFAANGWAHLMRWNGSDWQWVWGNNGGNKIALWQMKPDDRFIAGDFKGDGRALLLAMAAGNGWAHVMRWNGSDWQWLWGNNGDNKIGLWEMRPTDRYAVGDFDGTGAARLAVFSQFGWAHAMGWTGAGWQYLWGNDGGRTIHRWYMDPGDQYVAGRFDGGKALLLARSATNWAHLLKFQPVP
jgi:beta-glucanase (GH16 family)